MLWGHEESVRVRILWSRVLVFMCVFGASVAHAYDECNYVEARENVVSFREEDDHLSGLDGGHPESSPYHAAVRDMMEKRARLINEFNYGGKAGKERIKWVERKFPDEKICPSAEGDEKKMCVEGVREARELQVGEFLRLARSGKDVRVRDKAGLTPLHLEVKRAQDTEVINALLKAGADVNAADKLGYTPLHLAVAYRRSLPVVKALLEAGADTEIKDRFGHTPLHIAMACGESLPAITAMLEAGADAKTLSMEGLAPMHMLARNLYFSNMDGEKLEEWLVRSGVGVGAANVRDNKGRVPLHYAIWIYNLGMVKALVGLGADVNAKDDAGMTPIYLGAPYWTRSRNEQDLLGLREEYEGYGKNTGLDNDLYPRSVLELRAIRKTYFISYRYKSPGPGVVMETLWASGAEVDAVANDGSSPLHHAVYHANKGFVGMLLALGADPNLRMRGGRTPLYYALGSSYVPEILAALLEAGADRSAVAEECAGKIQQEWVDCARAWRIGVQREKQASKGIYEVSGDMFRQVFVGECVGGSKKADRCGVYGFLPEGALRALQVAYGHWRHTGGTEDDVERIVVSVEEGQIEIYFIHVEEFDMNYPDKATRGYVISEETLRIEKVMEYWLFRRYGGVFVE